MCSKSLNWKSVNAAVELIGKEFETNNYGKCVVTDYKDKNNVTVMFFEPKCYVKCLTSNLRKGNVRNPMFPSFYSKGYLGVGKYDSRNNSAFKIWMGILIRLNDNVSRIKQPTYNDVDMCEEWLDFQNFASWCHNQDGFSMKDGKGKGYQLDKDILVKGNKLYSPETCCFVPQEVNKLLTNRRNDRGMHPIGVTYEKDRCRFTAQILCYGKHKRLGSFGSAVEAFQAYKEAKESYIKEVAEKWKGKISDQAYESLIKWEISIDD